MRLLRCLCCLSASLFYAASLFAQTHVTYGYSGDDEGYQVIPTRDGVIA